ncbi:neo-calmodulin-like [Convolutriloba macropyga]|uniref:neo-calmodulin-like n=1 Tax=Convolutriloba macropyga TaxID=536237 RepID=UPI003F51FC21
MENLSGEKVDQARDYLSLFDKDGDSTISIDDIPSILRALGEQFTEAEMSVLVSKVKTESGYISFDEFLTFYNNCTRPVDPYRDVQLAFSELDRHKTGKISAKVLRHFLVNLGEQLTDEDVDTIFANIDVSDDGEIEYRQIIDLFSSF